MKCECCNGYGDALVWDRPDGGPVEMTYNYPCHNKNCVDGERPDLEHLLKAADSLDDKMRTVHPDDLGDGLRWRIHELLIACTEVLGDAKD